MIWTQIHLEEASENCNLLIYIALSALVGFTWSTAFGTTLSRIVSKLQAVPPALHKYLLHPLNPFNRQDNLKMFQIA